MAQKKKNEAMAGFYEVLTLGPESSQAQAAAPVLERYEEESLFLETVTKPDLIAALEFLRKSPDLVNTDDGSGSTALHFAAGLTPEQPELVRALLPALVCRQDACATDLSERF